MTATQIAGLRAQGVAVLLAYGGQILPPKRTTAGRVVIPGIECTGFIDVEVKAIGYATPNDAHHALNEAAEVCHHAGLTISPLTGETLSPHTGFVVRRSP